MVLGQRPPVAEIAPPGTPPALIELLERMVQVDRDNRPDSAKELIRQFKDIVRSLVGDLDTAKEQIAELVKEHYGLHHDAALPHDDV